MSGPVANKIRKLLSESGGMTAGQILEALGKAKNRDGNLYATLYAMPDAYIDRWTGPIRGQWAAVWAVVDKPKNAPKPTRVPK